MNINENRSEFKSELSKIATASIDTKEKRNELKEMTTKLKETTIRKGLLESRKTEETFEEPIRRPDVLGISPGKLMVYRDLFRKDGTIKAPKSIMEKIESSKEDRAEYIAFLKSE